MKHILAVAFLFALIATACVSPGDPMKKFVGLPSSQLEAKMGQPNERVRNGQNGEIWNYFVREQFGRLEQDGHVITGAYNTTDKGTTWNLLRPENTRTVHSFYVNRDGVVYRYTSRQE